MFRSRELRWAVIAAVGIGAAAISAVAIGVATRGADEPASNYPGLHHVIRASESLYSGSEPEGDIGFQSAAKLGVKTIVSVDGARPDLNRAARNGLRYVHIPIGYDGVPTTACLALARVMREAEKPIYIHCHHGRHRGPAAAAVACLAAGQFDQARATQLLVQAGTGRQYPGLWRSVAEFVPPSPDAVLPQLVEAVEIDAFTAAMADLDRAFDQLKLVRDNNWVASVAHPEMTARQAAVLVRESLHEATRHAASASVPHQNADRFGSWLAEAEVLSGEILQSVDTRQNVQAAALVPKLEAQCQRCHVAYRNTAD